MECDQRQKVERDLAVFSLAMRLGRREIPDLPKHYEMNAQELTRAAEIVGNRHFTKASEEVERAYNSGIRVLSCQSDDYPSSLLTIQGAPEVIFVRGQLTTQSKIPHVAIVGSRRPTREGRDFAERLGYQITNAGASVISGLAFGCDAAAHTGAVKASKLRTSLTAGIAVLGSGVNNIYPESHEELANDLILNGGAIVSEFGIESTPHKGCFPARNRIISGLANAVIVVEAGEKSGSLITARFAAEQGRDLYAVPGCFYFDTCKGTNRLLKEGAIPLTDFSDLKSILPECKEEAAKPIPDDPILGCLSGGRSLTLEEFCEKLSKSPAELLPKLIKYELKGIVTSDEGRFSLSV